MLSPILQLSKIICQLMKKLVLVFSASFDEAQAEVGQKSIYQQPRAFVKCFAVAWGLSETSAVSLTFKYVNSALFTFQALRQVSKPPEIGSGQKSERYDRDTLMGGCTDLIGAQYQNLTWGQDNYSEQPLPELPSPEGENIFSPEKRVFRENLACKIRHNYFCSVRVVHEHVDYENVRCEGII